MSFQTEELVPRVNKSEITGENSFIGDHFDTEANDHLINDEQTLFSVFLQICEQYSNP